MDQEKHYYNPYENDTSIKMTYQHVLCKPEDNLGSDQESNQQFLLIIIPIIILFLFIMILLWFVDKIKQSKNKWQNKMSQVDGQIGNGNTSLQKQKIDQKNKYIKECKNEQKNGQEIEQKIILLEDGQQNQIEQLKYDRDLEKWDRKDKIIKPLIEPKFDQSSNLIVQDEQIEIVEKKINQLAQPHENDRQNNENSQILVEQYIGKEDKIQQEHPQNQDIQQKIIQQEQQTFKEDYKQQNQVRDNENSQIQLQLVRQNIEKDDVIQFEVPQNQVTQQDIMQQEQQISEDGKKQLNQVGDKEDQQILVGQNIEKQNVIQYEGQNQTIQQGIVQQKQQILQEDKKKLYQDNENSQILVQQGIGKEDEIKQEGPQNQATQQDIMQQEQQILEEDQKQLNQFGDNENSQVIGKQNIIKQDVIQQEGPQNQATQQDIMQQEQQILKEDQKQLNQFGDNENSQLIGEQNIMKQDVIQQEGPQNQAIQQEIVQQEQQILEEDQQQQNQFGDNENSQEIGEQNIMKQDVIQQEGPQNQAIQQEIVQQEQQILEEDQQQQNQFGDNENSQEIGEQNIMKQDVIQQEGPQNQAIKQEFVRQEDDQIKNKDNVKGQIIHEHKGNNEKNEQINQQPDLDTNQYQNEDLKVINNQDINNQEHDIENFIINRELIQQQNLEFQKDENENQNNRIDVNYNPQKECIKNHNIDITIISDKLNEIYIPKNSQISDKIDQNQIQKQAELYQNHIAYEILNCKFYIHSFKKRQIDDQKLKLFVRDFCSVDKFLQEYNLDGSQLLLFQNQIQYFIPIRGDGNCLFTSIGVQYLYYNLIDDRRFSKFLIKIQLSEFKQICKDIRQENNEINDQLEYSVEIREEDILKQQFVDQIQQLKKFQDQLQFLSAISQQVNNHDGPFYGLLIIFMRNYFRKLLKDFSKIDNIGYIQNPDQIDEIITWEYMYNETDIALKLFATQEQILIRCYSKMNVDDKIVQISEYKDDELNQFQYKIGLAFQPGHYNAIILK